MSFSQKRSQNSGEMADLRLGQGIRKISRKHLLVPKRKEVLKNKVKNENKMQNKINPHCCKWGTVKN
jgi:hypothetical protein